MKSQYTMRDYFTTEGIGGFILSILGLLSMAILFWYMAIVIQQKQATNPYSIDTNINVIKALDDNQKSSHEPK